MREARLLLGLFIVQFATTGALPGDWRDEARILCGIVYLLLAAWQLWNERRDLPKMVHDGLLTPYAELVGNPNG